MKPSSMPLMPAEAPPPSVAFRVAFGREVARIAALGERIVDSELACGMTGIF